MNSKGSNNLKSRHIFIVSDATASTCQMVVKAALSQFKQIEIHLHRMRYARTEREVKDVVNEAMNVDGIIAHTLVSKELRNILTKEGKKSAVPTIDILGPILQRFTDYLEISPMAIPGLFRHLDKIYFQRIECINYAVKHDDGRNIDDISKAEIILLGPSRTSKTPISIYLAYRDYLVANIPLVLGIEPPEKIFSINKKKIFGLYMSPNRLKTIRDVRIDRYGLTNLGEYIDINNIKEEMKTSMNLYLKEKWHHIDVTAKSIEEAATEIMRIIGEKN